MTVMFELVNHATQDIPSNFRRVAVSIISMYPSILC